MSQLSKEQLESQVDTFNNTYKVGDEVEVWRVLRKKTFIDKIKHRATVLGKHSIIWLEKHGTYDLTFIKGLAPKEVLDSKHTS